MARRLIVAVALVASIAADAQTATDAPPKPASVDGIVLGSDTGRPLRRAEVALKPADGSGRAFTQTTDDKGQFSFPEVPPGNYMFAIHRDGYLSSSIARVSGTRLPPIFAIREGSHMNDVNIQLPPWGVIAGKVKFDDGEPAVNIPVQLYREYSFKSMHGFRAAASGYTNDRGEYRIHGLSPGTYYVAAVYQRASLIPGALEPVKHDRNGLPLPEMRYAVTFYPSSTRMTDAVPVSLAAGAEVGVIDIFLSPVPTVRVRGKVTSGLSGLVIQAPGISLRRADAGETASVTAPVNLEPERGGGFLLKGVVPGVYLVVLNGLENGKPLSTRHLLAVGESGVDDLNLVMKPPAVWRGKLKITGDTDTSLTSLYVVLEPRRETAGRVSAQVKEDGAFEIGFVPGERYDLAVEGGGPDLYLKSVRLGNADLLPDGVLSDGGPESLPLQVVLGIDSGSVVGRVMTSDSAVASGATVMLVPVPARGRVQFYKTTYADENGVFFARGVAPGRYLLLSWLDDPPCEVYGIDSIDVCRSKGTMIDVTPEGRVAIEVRIAQ